MNFKLQTLYWIVYNLAIFLGCFWQIFNVCDLYFKYPTNISIKTKFEPLSNTLPAITLVTYIGNHSFLNGDKAMDIQRATFKYIMFYDLYIMQSNGEAYDLSDEYLGTAIERVSLEYYSITLNSAITADNQTTWLKGNDQLHFTFQAFGLNDSWLLHLHNSYDMPSSYDRNAIDIKNRIKYKITWKRYAFQLLPSPYKTDCKVYRTSSQYLSRKDCIRNCKLRVSTKKCGFIWDGIDLMYRKERSIRFGDINNKSCIKNIDFDSICSKECPHSDCDIEYYEPVLTFMWEDGYDVALFDLEIPSKPETAYIYEPHIQTIEFICYLASTVCLWFGLSLYSGHSLLRLCFNNLIEIVHKYQLTMPIQITVTSKSNRPVRVKY